MQLSLALVLTTLLSAGALALPSEPVQARTHMNQTPWIAMYDGANADCSGDPLKGTHVPLDKGSGPKSFARTDITTNVKISFGDSKCIVAYTSYYDDKTNVVAKTFDQKKDLNGAATFCLTKGNDHDPEASLHNPWVKVEATEQC